MVGVLYNVDIPDGNQIVGGWLGNQLDNIGKSITDGIYNGFVAVMDGLCGIVFWASKIGILCCVIVYIASKDNKAISFGWKLALLYLIASIVGDFI
jgi:hypothetical protein